MYNILKLKNLVDRVEASLPDILKPWYVANGEFYKVYNNAYHMVRTKKLIRELEQSSMFECVKVKEVLIAELLALLHDIGNYEVKDDHINYLLGNQSYCKIACFTSLAKQEELSTEVIIKLLNNAGFSDLSLLVDKLITEATEITYYLMFRKNLSKNWDDYCNSALLLGMADALQVASPTHVYDIVYFSYQKASADHIDSKVELKAEDLACDTEVVERLLEFNWSGVRYPLFNGESVSVRKLLNNNLKIRTILKEKSEDDLLRFMQAYYEKWLPFLVRKPCFYIEKSMRFFEKGLFELDG